jgi:hypothetical protein
MKKHLPYSTYVKDIDLDAQIWVFKKAIKVNGKIINEDIINLFGFTLQDNIFEWGENFLHDHFNRILHNWSKLFVNVTKQEKMMNISIWSWEVSNKKRRNMSKFIMNKSSNYLIVYILRPSIHTSLLFLKLVYIHTSNFQQLDWNMKL